MQTLLLICWMASTLSVVKDDEEREASPMLLTDRSLERTGFQEASPYGARYDLRTDFVMAYGIGPHMAERLKEWKEAGYVLHVMTGVAWGNYKSYLDGEVDGRSHWDEAQVDAKGKPILHGKDVPYMVPTISFSDFLQEGLRKVIDAGVEAIHLEEPEFWAHAGFSEAFQREWQIYYGEPWQRPDQSCDAQYRASKLKRYLYRRALDRICGSMKEYALTTRGTPVRFYVPTHSLLNYTQWRIVSPESGLIDLPGVDGYIAQIWTGTARTPNTYGGKTAQRTFDTAYLEYGVMQELVRGTGRRMWFLCDPIEDNPRYDWDDYKENYICTLIASLLQPEVWHYEVCPWPRRVFEGTYPAGEKGTGIPDDYATVLQICFNQLRDMKQKDVVFPNQTEGVGVFLADSAMFQRAEPAFSEGVAQTSNDPSRATSSEVSQLSAFYGLALPVLKSGIPLRPVQLDNVERFPWILGDCKVLLLSYEFLKPLGPGLHFSLAQWVRDGGSLIYVGADTDPFHQVREWWNRAPLAYDSPSEHLMECLGLKSHAKEGKYRCGKGNVFVLRKHPAYFSRSLENAEDLVRWVQMAVKAAKGGWVEGNVLQVRRGPYVIASVLEESVSEEPLRLKGQFVDLLDAQLPVRASITVKPGHHIWLLDLKKIKGPGALMLAAAGRLESWKSTIDGVDYLISSPLGVHVSARMRLPQEPSTVSVDGIPCEKVTWHRASGTVLLQHPGKPEGCHVSIRY